MLRLLGSLLGAKHSSRSPLWPPPGITNVQFTEKRYFLKIVETCIFISIPAPMEKTLPLQNAHLRFPGPSWIPLGSEPCPSGPPWSVPGADHFLPSPPLAPPKTNLGAPKASRNRPRGAQERPRATSNPQSEHAQNVGNTNICPPGISNYPGAIAHHMAD